VAEKLAITAECEKLIASVLMPRFLLLGQTISDVLLCMKVTIPAAPQALQHEETHQIGGSNVWHARHDRNA
jgi:hypothetical protein